MLTESWREGIIRMGVRTAVAAVAVAGAVGAVARAAMAGPHLLLCLSQPLPSWRRRQPLQIRRQGRGLLSVAVAA
jgi:hypothetical protein